MKQFQSINENHDDPALAAATVAENLLKESLAETTKPEAAQMERITRLIDHPEALALRGGVAVFVDADGTPTMFDHENVNQITGDLPPNTPV